MFCLLLNVALYASPYVVVTPEGYTKHYFVESERFASRIGDGKITNISSHATTSAVLASKQATVNDAAPDSIAPNQFTFLRTLPARWSEHHTTYWQHPDHLGSASWVTDTNGRGYQHLQYRAWGEPFIDQRATSNGYETRYTFSSKERDEETGFSYFGSRYYNSSLSIWLSVDPMSDKYPRLSPYTYCANNPIKLVDPDGRDIWEINEEGRIVSHNATYKEKDIFYRVDNNGKRVESVSFDPGTIEKQKSISYSPDGKTVDTYDMYQVRGDDNGTKLFEFIAQTVSGAGIEVSQIQCGEKGKNGLNFITCSHEKPHDEVRNGNTYTVSSEKSGWLVFSGRLQYGYTIRAWNHSHPISTNASKADMSLKESANKILQDSGRACPQYNIYHVPLKKTIPY